MAVNIASSMAVDGSVLPIDVAIRLPVTHGSRSMSETALLLCGSERVVVRNLNHGIPIYAATRVFGQMQEETP